MGDLNTMGLMFPRPAKKFLRVVAPTEIAALSEAAKEAGMSRLYLSNPCAFSLPIARGSLRVPPAPVP